MPKYIGGFPTTASAIKIIDRSVATYEEVVVSTNPTLMKGGLNLTGDLVVSEDVAVSGAITTSSAIVAGDLTAENQSITGDLSVSGLITQSNKIRF